MRHSRDPPTVSYRPTISSRFRPSSRRCYQRSHDDIVCSSQSWSRPIVAGRNISIVRLYHLISDDAVCQVRAANRVNSRQPIRHSHTRPRKCRNSSRLRQRRRRRVTSPTTVPMCRCTIPKISTIETIHLTSSGSRWNPSQCQSHRRTLDCSTICSMSILVRFEDLNIFRIHTNTFASSF